VIFRFSFPIQTKSPNGARAHPMAQARGIRQVRQATQAMAQLDIAGVMREHLPRIEIRYSRSYAAQKMDKDDNLTSALKPVRDGICAAFGITNDESPLVRHIYAQHQGKPLLPQVIVEVEVKCLGCNAASNLGNTSAVQKLIDQLNATLDCIAEITGREEEAA
jgi:hypothetical protein